MHAASMIRILVTGAAGSLATSAKGSVACHECAPGDDYVFSHDRLVYRPLDPIDEIEDELQSAFRRVGVARPEPGIQDVAGLGDASHQGMIQALMVVAVP